MTGAWHPIAGAGLLVAWSVLTPAPIPQFRDVAVEAGLRFTHANGASAGYHLPEIMGSGGALLDIDGDGDLDVLAVQGAPPDGPPSSPPRHAGHRLFRNDLVPGRPPARLQFTDITATAGLASGDFGMGVAAGDYDNDGDPDLYLTNYGANRLYRNEGHGRFTDVTRQAGSGLDDPRWSTSATFSDYDADGDLDLYVANYVDYAIEGARRCVDPAGARDYCGPLHFRPAPDRLFRNNGNGTFTDVSGEAGITSADGAGLGVSGADLNGDGRLDFYVANDGTANQLWINRGDGTFEDGALTAGVALSMEGRPEGSMGVGIGDADNDGDPDIVVTNLAGESHALYENLGGQQFEDRRLAAGLTAATGRSTGFGTGWLDADHDGRLDLFIASGAVTRLQHLRGDPFPYHQKNQLLRNEGGLRFRDVSADAGPGMQLSEVTRGAAFGDVDNDGDVDVLLTNNGGPLRLLRNDRPPDGRWLGVQLLGVSDNRQGLGARVDVVFRDGTTLARRVHTDGSYLSASDPRVHAGLGTGGEVAWVVVEWPRGTRERWRVPAVGRFVTLKQGTGMPCPADGAGRESAGGQ